MRSEGKRLAWCLAQLDSWLTLAFPIPAPFPCTLVLATSPPDLSLLWLTQEDHGYHGNLQAAQLLVPLGSCTQSTQPSLDSIQGRGMVWVLWALPLGADPITERF